MSRLAVPAGARAIYHWPSPPAADSWTLYELPLRPGDSFLWHPFRLMLPIDTPARWRQRRAYTLTWNPIRLRFRKDSEHVALELTHPDLHHRVDLLLALSYSAEWLYGRGITDEAIAAERVRLRTLAAARRASKRAATPAV